MLASRILPPIVRPSSTPPAAPVATFFHVPRRYVKSSMQVGDSLTDSSNEDVKSSRSLRKSSRIHDVRHAPTSSPMIRTKGEDMPSPGPASPRPTRKRIVSLEETVGDGQVPEYHISTNLRSPQSATSLGSGDFSPHVCLCQPEPKIPRPRNGECSALVFRLLSLAWVV
jgi:hypothetical protein